METNSKLNIETEAEAKPETGAAELPQIEKPKSKRGRKPGKKKEAGEKRPIGRPRTKKREEKQARPIGRPRTKPKQEEPKRPIGRPKSAAKPRKRNGRPAEIEPTLEAFIDCLIAIAYEAKAEKQRGKMPKSIEEQNERKEYFAGFETLLGVRCEGKPAQDRRRIISKLIALSMNIIEDAAANEENLKRAAMIANYKPISYAVMTHANMTAKQYEDEEERTQDEIAADLAQAKAKGIYKAFLQIVRRFSETKPGEVPYYF